MRLSVFQRINWRAPVHLVKKFAGWMVMWCVAHQLIPLRTAAGLRVALWGAWAAAIVVQWWWPAHAAVGGFSHILREGNRT